MLPPATAHIPRTKTIAGSDSADCAEHETHREKGTRAVDPVVEPPGDTESDDDDLIVVGVHMPPPRPNPPHRASKTPLRKPVPGGPPEATVDSASESEGSTRTPRTRQRSARTTGLKKPDESPSKAQKRKAGPLEPGTPPDQKKQTRSRAPSQTSATEDDDPQASLDLEEAKDRRSASIARAAEEKGPVEMTNEEILELLRKRISMTDAVTIFGYVATLRNKLAESKKNEQRLKAEMTELIQQQELKEKGMRHEQYITKTQVRDMIREALKTWQEGPAKREQASAPPHEPQVKDTPILSTDEKRRQPTPQTGTTNNAPP